MRPCFISKFMSKLLPSLLSLTLLATGPLPSLMAEKAPAPATQEKFPPARQIGPGVAGFCLGIGVDPTNADVMVIGIDMGMFFITRDGGKNWGPIGPAEGLENYSPGSDGAYAVAFSVAEPGVIWLGSGGVFRVEKEGKVRRLGLQNRHSISSVAVDPGNAKVIYAGEGVPAVLKLRPTARAGHVYKSVDGGENWETLEVIKAQGEETGLRRWSSIVIDPSSPVKEGEGHQRLYATGDRELFLSEDGGKSWRSLLTHQPGHAEGFTLASHLLVRNDGTLYGTFCGVVPEGTATLIGGVYRSTDHGQSWTALNEGLTEELWRHKEHSIEANGIVRQVIPIGDSAAAPNRLYCAIMGEIYRSDDLGENWVKTTRKGMEYVPEPKSAGGGWFLPAHKGNIKKIVGDERLQGDRHFSAAFNSNIAVGQTNADRVILSPFGLMTDSGGKEWDTVLFEYGKAHKPGRFGDRPPSVYTHQMRSTGVQVIVPSTISFDPFDPKTLAISYADMGAFLSRDGGEWWELLWDGAFFAGKSWLQQTSQILFDPRQKGRIWQIKTNHGKFYPYGHYLYRSDDFGMTFTGVKIGPLLQYPMEEQVNEMAILPEENALLALSTIGLFRSEDEGETWKLLSETKDRKIFSGQNPYLIRPRGLTVVPGKKDHLFYRRDFQADGADGLYRSVDGGRKWEQVAPDKIGPATALTICESKPNEMYVTAAAPGTKGSRYSQIATRLWHSRDGGENWAEIELPKAYQMATAVTVHPEESEWLYLLAGTRPFMADYRTALLRSRDGGKNWELVDRSLSMVVNNWSSHFLTLSPHDRRHLFVGTESGVWELWDAEGKR